MKTRNLHALHIVSTRLPIFGGWLSLILVLIWIGEISFSSPIPRESITAIPTKEELHSSFYPSFLEMIHPGEMNIHWGGKVEMKLVNEIRNNYLSFGLRPYFSIYKFSVGLQAAVSINDMTLEDKQNYRDWNKLAKYYEWNNTRYVLPGKIDFIRWGTPEVDPISLYVGELREITLGEGTLVDRFSNMAYSPYLRIAGAVLDVDLHYAGIKAFINDIGMMDFMGFRGFLRPMKFIRTGVRYIDWVLSGLELGFGMVYDRSANRAYGTKELTNGRSVITRFTQSNSSLYLQNQDFYLSTQYFQDDGTQVSESDVVQHTGDPIADGAIQDGDYYNKTNNELVELEEAQRFLRIPTKLLGYSYDLAIPVFKHPDILAATLYMGIHEMGVPLGEVEQNSDYYTFYTTLGRIYALGLKLRIRPATMDLDVKVELSKRQGQFPTRYFSNDYSFYRGLTFDQAMEHGITLLNKYGKAYYNGWYVEVGRTFRFHESRILRFFFAYRDDINGFGGPDLRIGLIAKEAIPRLTLYFYADQYNLDIFREWQQIFKQDDSNSMIYAEFQFRITSNVEIGFSFNKGFMYYWSGRYQQYIPGKMDNSTVFLRTHWDF
jgi:hypothetical protein